MKINLMVPKAVSGTSAGLCLCLLSAGMKAEAGNDVWNGGGTTAAFSAANNWGGTAPTTGDTLEFGTTSTIGTALTNDLTGYLFSGITYDASGLGFTINGNAFTNGTSTAGTIFTVNSANAQTINNNIILGNSSQTINLASGNLTLGGVLSGAGTASGFTLTGGNTLTLSGTNTYGSAGNTTNSAGTIKIGNASALGASRLYVASGATVDLNGNNLTAAIINNVGALTGGVIDNVSAGGTVTLKVGGGQGSVTGTSANFTSVEGFSGNIKNTTGTLGLTKVAPAVANQSVTIPSSLSLPAGAPVLRLMNASSYTGPTTVSGGMLELNFGNSTNGGPVIANNIISPSSALVMAGGDLTIDTPYATGLAGAQTFASLTLNAGASHLASYRPGSGSASLTLGGITRNVGSTADLQSRPSGGSSNNRIGAADGTDYTTNVNANFTGGQQTILGGYITYNGDIAGTLPTWAVSGNTATTSKAITGLAVYTTNSAFTAAKDIDAVAGSSTPAAMTINSLRFAQAGAATVSSSGNIVVATGGILEAPQVGANAVAFNNNNLTSGNGQDLIINQLNTSGTLTIGANITDNSGSIGLTKSGQGALTLTPNSANTFSGQLTINAGMVTLGNASALNGVPALVFGGTSQTFGGSTSFSFLFANGTLSLNGNNASVSSLTASADSSGTAVVQDASAASATLTVNGSATTAFTGTVQDGTGGGHLSLVLSGSGSQTLGGTLTYSGGTTVSAGTLALTATPTATTNYAVNGTLNVTALTNGTLALTSPQVLGGSGTVAGNVTVASGATTFPGQAGTGVTNTIAGNLSYATGARAYFDLGTSATNSASDRIVLTGASSVLTCGSIQVSINLTGATLDTTNDYVLYKFTGGSPGIVGSFQATPAWLGTVPANSGSYTIITGTTNVRLHYTMAVAPTVVATATPATLVRNESTYISATVTPGGGTVTNVYLDMSSIGGSLAVPLTLSATANTYTNTVAIPAAAAVGGATLHAYAMDTTPLTGSGNITLTIAATNEVWNGASSDAYWSDDTNWASVYAPGLAGDSVTFDGTTQLTASMDSSYSLTSLTFASTAGAFTISTADSSVLTLTGPLTNNSANAQTVNVPVILSGTTPINTLAGNLTLGSAITGGGLTKLGTNTLYLGSSANAYTGTTSISNGTVSINNNAVIGTNTIILAGGTLASGYASGTRLTVGSPIYVPAGNTGNINLSLLNRLNGTVSGSGILNVSAPGGQDDFYGGWNTYAGQLNLFGGGIIRLYMNGGAFNGFDAATVTMTNVTIQVADNSTGNTINMGALSLDSTAVIYGPIAGANPLFIIGALNQNDYIGGTIEGNTRITKTGTGTLTMDASANLYYTGPTWINGGTLKVLGTIGSSPVTNYAGATLTGTGTFNAPVDLETNSTITPVVGSTPGIYGTLTCGSDLTFNGATNVVHINTNYCDLITVAGTLNLNSGTVKLVIDGTLTNGVYKLMGYTGSLNGSAGNLTLSGFSQSGQTAVLSSGTSGEIDLIVATIGAANLTWASAGAQNNYWDVVTSINWSNGPGLTVFDPSDHVTFNDTGAGNTTVDVRTTVQPSTTVVSGSQAYVFENTTGGGQLAGATNSLSVSGTGSLELDIPSSYGGTTTIGSGSTLTVGNGSDAASLGTGAIADNGTLVFNQTNNVTLPNVTGSGTFTANGSSTITLAGTYGYTGGTTVGSGASLVVGTGSATGPLLGSVTDNGTLTMNQSGSLSVSNITGSGTFYQAGSSVITLGAGNTWQGNTYVTHGTLKLGATNAIPNLGSVSGSTGWLILDGNATNAGTLDLGGYNGAVNALSGLTGTVRGDITNSASAGTNTLTVGNTGISFINTYAGLITENTNAGAGKIALVLQGSGTNYLNSANTYSGGTVLTGGGTLGVGNSTGAGSGLITESNGVTLLLSGSPVYLGNNILVGADATATNYSGTLGNVFEAQFQYGDANSSNIISGYVSAGADNLEQFSTNAGTVVVPAGSQLRFAGTDMTLNGGDRTVFDVEGTLNTRNGTAPDAFYYISLGAVSGAGYLSGAGNATGGTMYLIGLANTNATFSGVVSDGGYGNTAITKAGTGTQTFSGTVTNTGSITVSNGVLALAGTASFDHSASLKLGSGSAILDVSGLSGTTLNLGNSVAQTLSGIGAVNGSINEQANSFVSPGLGSLTASNTITLAGATTLQLNRTNAANCSKLVSSGFTISGPLTVTNVGPALQAGDSFQLFSTGVTGFSVTNLPTLTGTLYWTNRLATLGNIAVAGGVATYPTNITYTITSSNTLALSWPADHTGWRLQVQTNNQASGISSTPVDWGTVAGSTTMNATNLPIDSTKPTEFYRLVYP